MELSFVRVRHYTQAMQLLRVRNECREGMTHNTAVITKEQQEQFYFKHLDPHSGDKMYEAYLLLDGVAPIGYGLLKWEVADSEHIEEAKLAARAQLGIELQDGDFKGRYWMTAGLVEAVRGKGLSRLLIEYITEMGHREGHDVWIDVYDDNAALYGDIRVGYQFVSSTKQPDGRILHVMRHARERILRQSEAKWMIDHGRTSVPWAPMVAPIPFSISQEMVEVDAISREDFHPSTWEGIR